jgi:hypothetical protein
MTLTPARLAFSSFVFAVGIALVGCGGNSVQKYKDSSVDFDAKGDGPDAGADTGGTAGTDGSTMEALPAPKPGDGSRLVIGGQSLELVGSGDDSCTNQTPYWTDRWCAFSKPATSLGNTELWVINATKAAAGVEIKCNTLDPNCIRLTSGLLDDQQFHFRVHRFDGDSLIFSEGSSGFASGDIFAWRPGWTAPRKLTTQTGELCIGNKKSTTVICVDNVTIDGAKTKATLDLRVGTLDDPTGAAPPKIDTFIYATKDDGADDLQKYEWDISADGKWVAWSGRYDVAGKETLKVLRVGTSTPTTVTEDVSAWTISNDVTRWYWLRGFNYNGVGTASGALESAPFPAGTPTKSLAAKVGDYFEAGQSTGLLTRTNLAQGVGTLTLIPDRESPTTTKMIDTKVLSLFDVNAAGTRFLYTKNEDLLGSVLPVFDLFVAKDDGSTVCTLATSPTTFADPNGPKLLTSGSVAVFGRINGVTGEGEGFYVNVEQCKAAKFAREIYGWQGIGDEGFVFTDDLAAVNQQGEVSLRYAKATSGTLPTSGTQIQSRAGLAFAPMLPAIAGVMYTVGSGTAADGLYINTKLPFTTTPPIAEPDGGASAATDAGSGGGDAAATVDGGADGAGSSDASAGDATVTSDAAAADGSGSTDAAAGDATVTSDGASDAGASSDATDAAPATDGAAATD